MIVSKPWSCVLGEARTLSGPSPDRSPARDYPSLAVSSSVARDRREESVPCISIQVTCRPGTGSSLRRRDMGSAGLSGGATLADIPAG
jgi:hypothetical protein